MDDIIYTGSSQELMMKFKTEMIKQYEMIDLGMLHHFLGLGVIQTDNCIFLHQKKYTKTLLDKFGLKECKSVATPLAVNEKLSKSDGSEQADERLYRQIVGREREISTLDYGIAYEKGKEAMLIGYCDSDWSGSEDDMKSTSGYAFNLGSAMAITKYHVHHHKTRHINKRFHFIRDALQDGEIDLLYCKTEEQTADIFTKALARDQFEYLRRKLGLSTLWSSIALNSCTVKEALMSAFDADNTGDDGFLYIACTGKEKEVYE
ncbi:uncharacterized mitochondrial protein AtMg00810-like [Pyrus x bretschneideri]|uniref:uncharacterized mitochondrial protein AtMg00810-like n=1 Tax=Pyrus x bretschneideri TaxID=225117 RepID=UPI0020301ED3|nr:uncharacterized mitochondrial protein AtMg00810-like [Pyrus x bretschneideri]